MYTSAMDLHNIVALFRSESRFSPCLLLTVSEYLNKCDALSCGVTKKADIYTKHNFLHRDDSSNNMSRLHFSSPSRI